MISSEAAGGVVTFQYRTPRTDGNDECDVKRRITMTMNRMGELSHVFNSGIKFSLKMKIYKTNQIENIHTQKRIKSSKHFEWDHAKQ